MCKSGQCIMSILVCNGTPHCDDASDEHVQCENYYWQKEETSEHRIYLFYTLKNLGCDAVYQTEYKGQKTIQRKLHQNWCICSAGILFTRKEPDTQTNCSKNITPPRFRGGVKTVNVCTLFFNLQGKKVSRWSRLLMCTFDYTVLKSIYSASWSTCCIDSSPVQHWQSGNQSSLIFIVNIKKIVNLCAFFDLQAKK